MFTQNSFITFIILSGLAVSGCGADVETPQKIAVQFPDPAMETLVCKSETGIGYNGSFFYKTEIYLLMKDGTAYAGLSVPLDAFDAKQARAKEPEKWVNWRQAGGQFEIKDPKTGKWVGEMTSQARPAKPGEMLNRNAEYFRSTYSYGLGGVTTRENFYFNRLGRFETSISSLGSSSQLQYDQTGSSVVSAKTSDKSGTRSSTSGSAPGSHASLESMGSDGSGSVGQYSLDGYTLRLHFDNGSESRAIFAFCHDGRDETYIGDKMYSATGPIDLRLPKGWESNIDEDEDFYYSPKELEGTQVYQVHISSPIKQPSMPVKSWLEQVADDDFKLWGIPGESREVKEQHGGVLAQTITRYKKPAYNQPLHALYFAWLNKKTKTYRFLRIMASDSVLLNKYEPVALKFMQDTF